MDKDLQRAPHRNFNIYRSVPHKRMDTCGPDCVPLRPRPDCCIPD